MEQRTLVPDAGEVVLDQLKVENNIRLVMVLDRRARVAIAQYADKNHSAFTAAIGEG